MASATPPPSCLPKSLSPPRTPRKRADLPWLDAWKHGPPPIAGRGPTLHSRRRAHARGITCSTSRTSGTGGSSPVSASMSLFTCSIGMPLKSTTALLLMLRTRTWTGVSVGKRAFSAAWYCSPLSNAPGGSGLLEAGLRLRKIAYLLFLLHVSDPTRPLCTNPLPSTGLSFALCAAAAISAASAH